MTSDQKATLERSCRSKKFRGRNTGRVTPYHQTGTNGLGRGSCDLKPSHADTMQITLELIEEGKSPAGGWTRKQIELLGLSWPMDNGWKNRVAGNPISRDDARRFLALKGTHEKRLPKKRVATELPIPVNCPQDAMRTINSFWVWLERQTPEIRAQLNESLIYITRKNNSTPKP